MKKKVVVSIILVVVALSAFLARSVLRLENRRYGKETNPVEEFVHLDSVLKGHLNYEGLRAGSIERSWRLSGFQYQVELYRLALEQVEEDELMGSLGFTGNPSMSNHGLGQYIEVSGGPEWWDAEMFSASSLKQYESDSYGSIYAISYSGKVFIVLDDLEP